MLLLSRGTPPSPRSEHAAACFAERYLLIFGGGSHSTCFSDLHLLDTQTVRIFFALKLLCNPFGSPNESLGRYRWNGQDQSNKVLLQNQEQDMQV
jgi:hypothetical protein